jgi:hypothetical protein
MVPGLLPFAGGLDIDEQVGDDAFLALELFEGLGAERALLPLLALTQSLRLYQRTIGRHFLILSTGRDR